ncbi:N-6 DNA methylase [Leptotrichia sp. oral taxon 417]|uniref:Eco57I restriction-modification methylase domain-containing protein n=1 Tax=Leptotrichia sp. oral taxon 417 TaxID=712365 RepID=UPI0015BFFF6F|nr:DNA methyltransferase [Leptotrichia sp. oral taxon 417]NWO26241.1 N-6 DNA methylase [Leptotrichia sp. oral taxon 417]
MNNLFNQKILAKKAEEEVDLSRHNLFERRKALDKWINNLENGVLDNSKEEEFQGEFLYDIFTTILRAVNKSDGQKEWNLERETKTKMDGQKADGVLGFFDVDGKKDVRAVIELKGAKVSLDVRQKRVGDTRTPVEQAFNYAPKYGKNCQWVIVSNYKEIRLYRSNDMTEYQVFFLEKLKDDLEFKKFIYILSFYALVGTEEKKAKTIELSEEYQKNQTEIEKKFYNEYKTIRLHIFENMRKNNPTVNENIIIEKVQKLLDRFLFICFCEDKGLLPNEIFYKTLEKGKNFGDIFEVFKMLCSWINLGNARKNIAHFNGGLFKNDDVLDGLYVDNEVFEEMRKISEYDFDSELNENILGHIFEQSVSDIEELKKSVLGEEFDSKKSKRKKDGIFYTPKYITKYIVENSIKNWLDDKRKELGEDELPELTEKDFEIKYASKKSDKRIYSENFKKHIDFWTKYREAVKNIKIVDPACGSGAFLITAFEYLLNYNNYLNDKIFDLTGTKDLFSDTTREILQNNIFGVDLNKESVEITKLSLWLKTADKNKTLASLENNIKCGNSLINDIEIAGELSFDWEKEFPQVFENGGFDIVVGNPPYVSTKQIPTNDRNYYWDKYKEILFSEMDLYEIFIYKSINELLKNKGYLGFITPDSYFTNTSFELLRKYLLEKTKIIEIIDFPYRFYPFEEVNTETAILILNKKIDKNFVNLRVSNRNVNNLYLKESLKNNIQLSQEEILMKYNNKIIVNMNSILNKLLKNSLRFGNYLELHKGWMSVPKKIKIGLIEIEKGIFTKEEAIKNNIINNCSEYLEGRDIHRYFTDKVNKYVYIKNIDKTTKDWHFSPKIILQRIVGQNRNKIFATIDLNQKIIFPNANLVNLKNKKDDVRFYLTILNSRLISYFYNLYYGESNTNLTKIAFENIPLVNIENINQQPFIEKADKILFLNKNLQEISQKFQRMLMREFGLEKISTKLQNWYLLNFDEFIKELSKVKVKLNLSQKADWENYFIAEKSKAETLNNEITKTDKEIDGMVYELYGLSEEEIKIIERGK